MNMPGFTGEASLYKTGSHYYKPRNLTKTDGAYPALSILYQMPLVLDFPFAHFFTELCCSKCRYSCVIHCLPARRESEAEYLKCIRDCKGSCTLHCNAQKFGGCDALLGY